jgi:anti-anti-sigma regulatory factor
MNVGTHSTSDHTSELSRGQGPTRVLVVAGASAADVERELRESLLGAIADGAREILLDLQEVDLITSSSLQLVEAVSATLADRGGALLVLTGGQRDGEPYLMREVRGTARDALLDGRGATVSDAPPAERR